MTFSPDGTALYYTSLSKQHRLVQISLLDGKERVLVKSDDVRYQTSCCLPDGRVVVGGTPDGVVHLVNPKDGKVTKLMEEVGGYTAEVSAIPSGIVLIQNADTLYLYNAKQEKLLRSISFQQTGSGANGYARAAKTHQEWPKPVHLLTGAVLSPDGTTLAVGLGNSGVSVFPVDDVKKAQHLKTIGPYVGSICFAPDGKTLAVSSYDTPKIGVEEKGQVELFDLASGKKKVVPTGDSRPAGLMCFDSDGKRLVIYEFGGSVQTWDVARSREINRLKFKLTDIRAVAASCDGKLFAIANTFGYEVWNLEDGKRVLSSRTRD